MKTIPLFSIGFRPLFASGSLFGFLALLSWGGFWFTDTSLWFAQNIQPFGGMMFWHPHEMIMGFSGAIVIGFLLTAVRNWTGLETTTPRTLLLIVCAWWLARLVMLMGAQLPLGLLLFISPMPFALTAIIIGIPIIKKRMWRNVFAPLVLFLFAGLDVAMMLHMTLVHAIPNGFFVMAVFLLMLLITIIGGRIVPFFMANKLGVSKTEEPSWLFKLSVFPLLLLLISSVSPDTDSLSIVRTFCVCILFFSHTARLVVWHRPAMWQHPMLWSLFIAYATMPLGFLLLAIDNFFPNFDLHSIALHVMTVGTLCGFIVSMVSRVSLGHTGRAIKHDKTILTIIVLMLLAACVRTIGIAIMGIDAHLIVASAMLASASLGLLFFRFFYIWCTPRFDQN